MVIIQTFGFFIFAAGVILVFITADDPGESEQAEDERWVPGAPGVLRIPTKETR